MMERALEVGAVLLAALVVVALTGCGGGGRQAPTVRVLQVLHLEMVPGVSANDYRWKDIAGNVYSAEFQTGFSYSGQPTVSVTLEELGTTLRGSLSAAGLKPNFAYQVKLLGKPTRAWGTAGDDWSNERIGRLGRWWAESVGNVDDAYYDANKDRETISGYLVFDFILTDELGNANKQLKLDSSYHVLWNTRQRNPGGYDRPSQTRTLAFTSQGYLSPFPVATSETIYPEWESGRPSPGAAQLPNGSYRCGLLLTEESFHDAPDGVGPGGSWAYALWNTGLHFSVGTGPLPDLAVSALKAPVLVRARRPTLVTVTVSNVGTINVGTAVLTLTDTTTNQLVGSVTIKQLQPRRWKSVSARWTPAIAGRHLLTAEVTTTAGDGNPANNARTVQVDVR